MLVRGPPAEIQTRPAVRAEDAVCVCDPFVVREMLPHCDCRGASKFGQVAVSRPTTGGDVSDSGIDSAPVEANGNVEGRTCEGFTQGHFNLADRSSGPSAKLIKLIGWISNSERAVRSYSRCPSPIKPFPRQPLTKSFLDSSALHMQFVRSEER